MGISHSLSCWWSSSSGSGGDSDTDVPSPRGTGWPRGYRQERREGTPPRTACSQREWRRYGDGNTAALLTPHAGFNPELPARTVKSMTASPPRTTSLQHGDGVKGPYVHHRWSGWRSSALTATQDHNPMFRAVWGTLLCGPTWGQFFLRKGEIAEEVMFANLGKGEVP